MAGESSTAARPMAFYDGGCSLCRREIAHYRAIDRNHRVEWVDINADRRLLEALGVSHEQAMKRMHVLGADGILRDGAVAFVELWSALPYYRVLARLIHATRTAGLLEAIYRRFARWRYARRREQPACATPGHTPRSTLKKFAALAGVIGVAVTVSAQAEQCPAFLDFEFRKLHSNETVNICGEFGGRPLLIVNTASRCGFTPQFEGLEALHREYGPKGLVVLGFPSDDFRQEADSEAETATVCYLNYGVTFTMLAPVSVKGDTAHPLFAHLARETRAPRWNFTKYLVDRDGRMVQRFDTTVEPASPQLTGAIKDLL